MRKLTAILLLLALMFSLGAPTVALSPAIQHEYSKEANSGIRHEVCTTLFGTSAPSYYTEGYTYAELSTLSGSELLQTLRTFLTETHTHYTTYGDCRDYAVKTDCENGDGTSINLLYSSFVTNRQGYINDTKKGWNREHVWPVSLGKFSKNDTPGCDLHHIRPTDSSLNGTRGNDKYGEVEGGREVTGTVVTNHALGGTKGGGLFEPLDNVKGDVARICLYMYVRYGAEYEGPKSITNVFESIDTLLAWCELDPVDTWEMGRNEVVQAIQGNRNPFIDYPELAWLLFDREVPEGLETSTTNDANICTGDHVFSEWVIEKEATETENGIKSRHCTKVCMTVETAEIPSWSTCSHKFVTGAGHEDGAWLICSVCNYSVWESSEDPAPDLAWVWIAVAAVGVIAAAAVVIVTRKKKKA